MDRVRLKQIYIKKNYMCYGEAACSDVILDLFFKAIITFQQLKILCWILGMPDKAPGLLNAMHIDQTLKDWYNSQYYF